MDPDKNVLFLGFLLLSDHNRQSFGGMKKAMKRFSQYGSMKKAFEKLKGDRNTIARTAVIAELFLTFPDRFKELNREHDDKIVDFAERYRNAITKDMAEVITENKHKGKLLPIMYQYT